MISGDMTWQLCSRNQAVLATLDDRLPGANVQIGRMVPRTASVSLRGDDPAVASVSEGDKVLRCLIGGWTDPAFVGRVSERDLTFDEQEETYLLNAIDPWPHLSRSVLLNNGLFPSGIRSWRSWSDDQVAIFRDLVNMAGGAAGSGIVMASSLPIGPTGGGTFASDGGVGGASQGWANPANAAGGGGGEAETDFNIVTSTAHSDWLKATNWGFQIPSSAVIVGISASVARRSQYGPYPATAYDVHDYDVRLVKGGVVQGNQKKRGTGGASGSGAGNTDQWPGGSTYADYGGSSDTWGVGLSPADVNAANFGIVIAAEATLPGGGFGIVTNAYVDHIRLIVYWRDVDGEVFASPSFQTTSFPAGSNIADNIASLQGMAGAFEYELTPTAATDGKLATVKIFQGRQGRDLSGSVVLKLGVDDTDNLVGLSYNPSIDGMVNNYLLIGDVVGSVNTFGLDWPTHNAVQASHAASIAAYGSWQAADTITGVTDNGKLSDAAKAMVAANAYPYKAFGLDLDPDEGPVFGPDDDFWMGDRIMVHGALPEESINLLQRVAGATLTEGENRDVDVAIVTEPEHDLSGVSVSFFTVVVDSGDGQVPPPPEPLDDSSEPASPAVKKDKKGKKKKGKKRR